MESLSLTGVIDEQIAAARSAHAGRAANTVYGGHEHSLRQTVIALAAGQELAEHETPGEATLLVLRGHVRLIAGADSVDGSVGDYLVVPPDRHSLSAIEDSAVLFTVLSDQGSQT